MEISPITTRLDGSGSRSTDQSSINNQLPTETENAIAITKTHQITTATATSDSDSFTNESSSVRLTTIKDSLKLQAAKSESERHEGELKSRISMVSQSPSNYRQSVNRGGLVSGESGVTTTVGRSSNMLQRNETFTKFRRSSVMSNTHTPRISQEQDSSMTINNLNSNLNKNNNNKWNIFNNYNLYNLLSQYNQ